MTARAGMNEQLDATVPPLLIRSARVLTMGAYDGPRRGTSLSDLGVRTDCDVLIEGGVIANIGPQLTPPRIPDVDVVDARGRVLMPAFVDCHTHACWAGARLDEWDQTRRGVPYLSVLASGGGIMSSVRAVRAATRSELAEQLLARLNRCLFSGTGTLEVKSGYGLTSGDELKMLGAIDDAAARFSGRVTSTALLGHAIDPAQPDFVDRTINETLPLVLAVHPGITVDAYCETGAWSVEDCAHLFERARVQGARCRVHADQFHSLGMVERALTLGLRSVDHLEASTDEDLRRLANAASAFGVMLPACGFHLDGRYGRARTFVDAGGALCLATNLNPGSAPCYSISMIIALAVRHMGLSPAEAIVATTANPARLLGLRDRGRIAVGLQGDLLLLSERDERALAYEFGDAPIDRIWIRGRSVRAAPHPSAGIGGR
ncbi:MAG: imidazolonepropionase [Phycisphaerae bacterium]|nr:imidazolonepropionase [Phycisphaerae bacterium]